MPSPITVISHFYNEEYLLPWWLKHHSKLFDHGILINRGSTDRSVEIIRKLTPHWEVRKAQVKQFDAAKNDQEVMKIESGIKGWKIVLNTTEFFCCRDISRYYRQLKSGHKKIYRLPAFVMVDDPRRPMTPDAQKPLVSQGHFGYFDGIYHARFIHCHPHGAYTVGRHHSRHPHGAAPLGAFIKWFAFCPWNSAIRKRKLQIKKAIPASDRALGRGHQHFTDAKGLERQYLAAVKKAGNLRLNPIYRTVF